MEKISKEEIQRLLDMGFSLELIANEFGLDIEMAKTTEKKAPKYNSYDGYEKMQIMRRKYNSLYLRDNSFHNKQPLKPIKPVRRNIFDEQKEIKTTLSEEDNELIMSIIENIRSNLYDIKNNKDSYEKIKIARIIVQDAKKILDYPATFEQLELLFDCIHSEELDLLPNMDNNKLRASILKKRRDTAARLAESMCKKLDETDNLDALEMLSKKITPEMISANPIVVQRLKTVIGNKKSILLEKQVAEKIRYNISPEIEKCIIDLTRGKLNIEKARKLVEKEAKRKVDSQKEKNPFSLTEEQQKRQILHQIRTVIADRGDKYPITNSENALSQIQELCGGQEEISLRAVVKNLLTQKDYEQAKKICQKCFSKGADQNMKQCIYRLEREINHAEISEYVLAGIKRSGSPAEESSYFELIERGLRQSGIKMKDISLGKSRDGLKEITLEDIWPDEQHAQRHETRTSRNRRIR